VRPSNPPYLQKEQLTRNKISEKIQKKRKEKKRISGESKNILGYY